MLKNIRACSSAEALAQMEYLRATPVSCLVKLVEQNHLVLFRASIESLTDLGKLKTEFGVIGRLHPSVTSGCKKFLVSEIVPTLRANPDVNDDGLLQRIERIVELEDIGAVEYNTTILDGGLELVIKDGNKRTIAYFERFREKGDQRAFDVFVLRPRA